MVFCAVKVFEGRALLLVINGRGSVKEYAPPQYRVSCLYREGSVNLILVAGLPYMSMWLELYRIAQKTI